ncbi:MAG TPA: transglycosylase SLT domain-containing protein [Thermaerobacter sp.]
MPGDRENCTAPDGGVGGSFAELFQRAGRAYGLDPALLWAVAMTESSLNPRAVSPVGAMGLMQLMPDTARMLGCEDPFDPAQNIDAGTRYLRQLLDQFGDVALALAAYNAGPHVVERYGGIPPYRETMAYVEKVQRLWRVARERQGGGGWAGGQVPPGAAPGAATQESPPATAGGAVPAAPPVREEAHAAGTQRPARVARQSAPSGDAEPPAQVTRENAPAAGEHPGAAGAATPDPRTGGLPRRLFQAWARWRRRNA